MVEVQWLQETPPSHRDLGMLRDVTGEVPRENVLHRRVKIDYCLARAMDHYTQAMKKKRWSWGEAKQLKKTWVWLENATSLLIVSLSSSNSRTSSLANSLVGDPLMGSGFDSDLPDNDLVERLGLSTYPLFFESLLKQEAGQCDRYGLDVWKARIHNRSYRGVNQSRDLSQGLLSRDGIPQEALQGVIKAPKTSDIDDAIELAIECLVGEIAYSADIPIAHSFLLPPGSFFWCSQQDKKEQFRYGQLAL